NRLTKTAAKKQYITVVEQSLGHVNQYIYVQLTALHYAADRGDLNLLDFLLRQKANVNCLDNDGQTPLHYGSAECGHEEAVIKLLNAGADTAIATCDGKCSKYLAITFVLIKNIMESFNCPFYLTLCKPS
uniref:ANK_REP_REGION domain-containing protein n=1 Tax=Syphacia muris TaxID=451379 RepID=A0A0N5AKS7_9BILA